MKNNNFKFNNLDEDGDEIREEFMHEDKKIEKKDSKLHKYISFATGFVYTILAPILFLLAIYFTLEKYIGFKRSEVTIIALIFIGLLTGYWMLFKDIKHITGKGVKNESKDKKTK